MNSRPLGRVWGGASKELPLLGEGWGGASGWPLASGPGRGFPLHFSLLPWKNVYQILKHLLAALHYLWPTLKSLYPTLQQ